MNRIRETCGMATLRWRAAYRNPFKISLNKIRTSGYHLFIGSSDARIFSPLARRSLKHTKDSRDHALPMLRIVYCLPFRRRSHAWPNLSLSEICQTTLMPIYSFLSWARSPCSFLGSPNAMCCSLLSRLFSSVALCNFFSSYLFGWNQYPVHVKKPRALYLNNW